MYVGGGCREGAIRLVGGSYSWWGRIELCLSGTWANIQYYYSRLTARVICHQLGYDTRCT